MDRWDIAETRDQMVALFDSGQLVLARNCLRAVDVRFRHSQYHFQEIQRLLRAHFDDRLEITDMVSLTFFPGPEEQNALEACLIRVEAHMIACAQSIHSVADALAHVVYYGIGGNLSPNPLAEGRISLGSVVVRLQERGPSCLEIEQALATLRADPGFDHIDAIVNYGKHRGLPDPRLQIGPEGSDSPYAMEFGGFEFRSKRHADTEFEAVLAPAYAATSRAVVDTGRAINRFLATLVAAGSLSKPSG